MASKSPKISGRQTIFWWVMWITLTIASFFAAAAFWTPVIAQHFGSVRETRAAVIWIGAVFGTWMLLLLPLIIVMYQKVDKAYEDARIAREKAALRFRAIEVERKRRTLPPALTGRISQWPETIQGGHLVHLRLHSGREIPNVFVAGRSEILGLYNMREMDFEAADVADIFPSDLDRLPAFLTTQWLRLDGVTAPE